MSRRQQFGARQAISNELARRLAGVECTEDVIEAVFPAIAALEDLVATLAARVADLDAEVAVLRG